MKFGLAFSIFIQENIDHTNGSRSIIKPTSEDKKINIWEQTHLNVKLHMTDNLNVSLAY